MTIVLRGVSIEDAAGVAEIEGLLRLVRPPYQLPSSPELSPSDLDEAIRRSAFQRSDRHFSNYVELISYLRHEHEEWVKGLGLPLGGIISAVELISSVGPSVVYDVLDRIEREMLPAGLFEQAEALLLAIIQSRSAEHLAKERAAAAMGQIKLGRNAKGRRESSQVDRRFVTLNSLEVKAKIQNIKNQIRDRHCVLELRVHA
jgi:hypothetical protein